MRRWALFALAVVTLTMGAMLLMAACGRSSMRIGGGAGIGGAGGAGGTGGVGGTTSDAGLSGGGDAQPDVGVDCLPQDAHAEGPCATLLPGVIWDGQHCLGLGSGCSCAGEDCDELYETVQECVAVRLGCYTQGCEAQPVADDRCIDCTASVFLGAFWNGRDCFELFGCGCAGGGCFAGFASLPECEAVQARCDGARCVDSGGEWFPAAAGFCGFTCGALDPLACEAPVDSCRCPAGQTFQSGSGCAVDGQCTDEHRCAATYGTWHPAAECYCGFVCGHPGSCDGCLDSCDCGPHRTFVPGVGCEMDPLCEPEAPAVVCAQSGGIWHSCGPNDPCSCGDYVCGVPNTVDPCVAPGCDCGPGRSFDDLLGCLLDESCWLRADNQECTGFGTQGSSCRPGLACCEHCGVMAGCSWCEPPCCEQWPECLDDGCLPPPP